MKKLLLGILLSVGVANAQQFFSGDIAVNTFSNLNTISTPITVTDLTIFATNSATVRFYNRSVAAYTNEAYTASSYFITNYTQVTTNYFPVLTNASGSQPYATNLLYFTNTWQGLRTFNYTVAANRGTEFPRIIQVTVTGNGAGNPPVANTFSGRWYFTPSISVSNSGSAVSIQLQYQ